MPIRSALCLAILVALPVASPAQSHKIAIAIHGGAGTLPRDYLTPDLEARHRAKMEEALGAGHAILAQGGQGLDAVVAAINILEDSPLFNAGKGAVFNSRGQNELDASIMDGATLNAGAVAGVRHIRNPINLARLVMEQSRHLMLIGEGAEEFAWQHGVAHVPNEYFYTERRWRQLQEIRGGERAGVGAAPVFGTVGCVVLDSHGHLAAGTSTGGLTNKRFGRVGDTPIIGAGTYANNATLAMSATGTGEFFMRAVAGHDLSALMEYKGLTVGAAADLLVMTKLTALGGDGGIIAVDRNGNIAMVFNTQGMYRGAIDTEGRLTTGIYRDR